MLLNCTCEFWESGEISQLNWVVVTELNFSLGSSAQWSSLCLPLSGAGAVCGVQSTSLGVQDKSVLDLGWQWQHKGQQPWAVQQYSWTVPCTGDCVALLLFVFLFEVIQFVRNCLCWTAFSAGLASVADLTLSSVGYMAKLAGKAVWCCTVLEMGKSGRAPVSEWVVKNQLCYWNRLEEATGRGEEAVTGTVLLAELMYFELLP